MIEKVKKLREEIESASVSSEEDLEKFRLQFISKKGELASLFQHLREIPNEKKKEFGHLVNEVKQLAHSKFRDLIQQLNQNQSAKTGFKLDLSLPTGDPTGSIHPITATKNNIIEIFKRIGFHVALWIGLANIVFELVAELADGILDWPGGTVSQPTNRSARHDADVVSYFQ